MPYRDTQVNLTSFQLYDGDLSGEFSGLDGLAGALTADAMHVTRAAAVTFVNSRHAAGGATRGFEEPGSSSCGSGAKSCRQQHVIEGKQIFTFLDLVSHVCCDGGYFYVLY